MKPLIAPMGIGDLKVTKQKLLRYEAGEVAHIENVLARERRGRQHRRLRQVEELVVREEEREEESRRDLQSTERFELESESQQTIKSETTFQAGLELSASYGPISLNALAKFASNNSKEESDTNSTKYAKEVVEKTTSRLLERVREERRTRTLEEVEETNTHGFRNDSAQNVTGVYRWVDKIYRQKVVNYGKRLMFQFVVPEPAAFYLFAQRYNYESKVLPAKPAAPTAPGTSRALAPQDINRTNYRGLVASTGATDAQPAPADQLVLVKTLSREIPASGNGAQYFAFTNEDIEVPKGYQAVTGWFARATTFPEGSNTTVDVFVGGDYVAGPGYEAVDLGNASGKIGVSMVGYNIRGLAMTIQIQLSLTTESYQAWQLATYKSIMNAYRAQLLDYQERLAAMEIQQGVAIGGNNPLLNRETEKEELKRACLILWAGSEIDVLDGVVDRATTSVRTNPPEIIRGNAIDNGTTIDFFERAFDWRNITYALHPYFWGRESTWLDRSTLKSVDPILERFLKAGAATVTVPVQPSFTEAVLWYQLTGDIWTGGPIPELSSTGDPDAELYNGYLTEIADESDVVDVEADVVIDEDDPNAWVVRLPTTLVWLQPGPELPSIEEEQG